jgi:quinol monooxygenase YgiN
MLARVTRVRVKPEYVDSSIRTTDDEIIADLKDDPGLIAFYVMGNRETGESMVITMWEDEETEEASRAKLAQRFGILGEYLAGQPEPSNTYEVMNSFVPTKATTP